MPVGVFIVSTTRLQLKKVEFSAEDAGQRAGVLLKLGSKEYRGDFEAGADDSALRIIAEATFIAVNRALGENVGMSVDVTLKVAEELKPIFMEKSLFIVIVDVQAGSFNYKPTGAVVAENKDAYRATAAAALDSLNRLIQHILMLNRLPAR